MKHFYFVILAVLIGIFSACSVQKKPDDSIPFSKEGSYALGMNIGSSMKNDGIYPDMRELLQGMNDMINDTTPRYTMEEAYEKLNDAFAALTEERNKASIQAEEDFLTENSEKPGIMVTDSGLQYEVITEGFGPKPTASDQVKVHYEGTLIDGTVFDSSIARGEPVEFPLGGVIPGWTEGLQLMNVGSTYRLIIPSELGYGSQGTRQIPPYSPLIFEVQLIDIIDTVDTME